jgi:Transposase DDE domain
MDLAIVPVLRRPLRPELAPDPLRDRLAGVVEQATLGMLDPERIEGMAEDMGVVRRKRVHHLGLLVCSLVLSALERSTDTEGRWLDAQTTYRSLGGEDSSKTSFRIMARKAVPVMNRLMRRRLKALGERVGQGEMRGRLEAFADVLIPDGSAFKLASALSGVHPGTGCPAELKLHTVYSVRRGTAVSITATAGSVHDSDEFWPETWEAGALYIWDLGYNSYERFIDAKLADAHVLQRLKDRANPVVIASYGPTGCRNLVLDDEGGNVKLNDACEWGLLHQQSVLDLDIQVQDDKHRKVDARLVCVPYHSEDRWYLTTLPRDMFTPYDVAEIYRIRWEVELFFRNWKGAVRLDQVRRLRNPASLLAAVSASLLAAVLSREIAAGLDALVAANEPPPAAPAAFPPGAPAVRTAAARPPTTRVA